MTWAQFIDVTKPQGITKKDYERCIEQAFYHLGRLARDGKTGIAVPKFGTFYPQERKGEATAPGSVERKPYHVRAVAFRPSIHLKTKLGGENNSMGSNNGTV